MQASSYTPSDAQVLTHIPFVADFSLTCANGAKNVNLYAELEGGIFPVPRLADGRYQVGGAFCFHLFSFSTFLKRLSVSLQVSWTEDARRAKSGDHSVNLYDDEGYAAVKRQLERGELTAAKPLVTIVINYAGAYSGPVVNSELLAAALAGLVFYLAYSSKAALLA